jgi:hypothetical protein
MILLSTIASNKITSVPEGLFQGLSNLKHVYEYTQLCKYFAHLNDIDLLALIN